MEHENATVHIFAMLEWWHTTRQQARRPVIMGQLSHYHRQKIQRHEAVVVTQEKFCDICQSYGHPNVVAVVDGKTWMGPWANMCESHFEELGVGLGLGKGQQLIVQEYNPTKGEK